MAFCKSCGNALNEEDKVCPACGTTQEETAAADAAAASSEEPIVTPIEEPVVAKASGVLNTLQLVWSIINIILCCMPLGVASLVMAILAKDAPSAAEEEKKLKTAKLCNIIGTVGGAVFYIVYVALAVIGALASM